MDFYAQAGTPVHVYAAPKHAASVTASVLRVAPTCASGNISHGGHVVFIGIFHEGVRVGDIAYAHVNPDFNRDGVTNATDLNYRGSIGRWGGYIGTVGKYTRNSCWDVANSAGHHVHLELANVKNYSCYRSLGAGSVINTGEYMGYLGGGFASSANRPCPSGA